MRLAFVLLVLVGCAQGQSYDEAMRILCAADRAPSVVHASPAERNRQIAMEIEVKVSNKEVLGWFGELGQLPPDAMDASVAEHAKRAGLTSCLGRELVAPPRTR